MRTLKAYLTAIVVAVTLPAVCFGLVAAYRLAHQLGLDRRHEAERQVETIAGGVGEHVALITKAMQVLARSPSLVNGDLAVSYQHAAQLAEDFGHHIGLAHPDGRQIFNTRRPFGERLPRRAEATSYTRALATGHPSVSNVITGAIARAPLVTIDVPVATRDGPLVLGTSTDVAAITAVMARTGTAPDWYAAVIDGNGRYVSRIPGQAEYEGAPAAVGDAEAPDLTSVDGWIDRPSGSDYLLAYHKVPGTDWTAIVGVPTSALSGPLQVPYALLVVGGVGGIALTSLIALLMGRRLITDADRLIEAAGSLGRGDPIAQRPPFVAEFQQVHEAMRHAASDIALGRMAQDRLAAMLDQSANLLRDRDGRIQHWTSGCTQLYGWSAAEAVGQISHDLLMTEFPEPLKDIEAALEAAGSWHGELHHRRKDGARIRVSARWVLSEGTVIESFTDLTGQTRAEAALRVAKADAEAANLAKSKFLAAASHDLRQPTQSLVLMSEVLRHKATDPALNRLATMMEQAVGSLSLLLNSILDLSKLDAGVIVPAWEDVPLNDLLGRLYAEYCDRGSAAGVSVRMAPCSLTIRTDPALFERVVRNLIENALRYTPSGKILFGVRRKTGGIRLDVVDTGIGIDTEHFETIFDEFHQLANEARDRSKGLGLGLSIVKRTVQLLGGRIEVASAPGRGSRFSVHLPASPADTPALEEA